MMRFLKKYGYILVVVAYGIFYMAAFLLLERRIVNYRLIHAALDDYIPFCKYFIVPYILWFGFVAGTVVYFAFFVEDRREYYRLITMLGVGMTVFLAVSFLYPNGHGLRPVLVGDDIFTRMVRALYRADTPTNILPSIHVFHSISCCIALLQNEACRRHVHAARAVCLLSVLIVLSTMFLKQHSVVDVGTAIALNLFCSFMVYKRSFLEQYGMLGREKTEYAAQ